MLIASVSLCQLAGLTLGALLVSAVIVGTAIFVCGGPRDRWGD